MWLCRTLPSLITRRDAHQDVKVFSLILSSIVFWKDPKVFFFPEINKLRAVLMAWEHFTTGIPNWDLHSRIYVFFKIKWKLRNAKSISSVCFCSVRCCVLFNLTLEDKSIPVVKTDPLKTVIMMQDSFITTHKNMSQLIVSIIFPGCKYLFQWFLPSNNLILNNIGMSKGKSGHGNSACLLKGRFSVSITTISLIQPANCRV